MPYSSRSVELAAAAPRAAVGAPAAAGAEAGVDAALPVAEWSPTGLLGLGLSSAGVAGLGGGVALGQDGGVDRPREGLTVLGKTLLFAVAAHDGCLDLILPGFELDETGIDVHPVGIEPLAVFELTDSLPIGASGMVAQPERTLNKQCGAA